MSADGSILDRILAAGGGVHPRQRLVYRVAYLPAPEFAACWDRRLLDPTTYPRHEDYRRELEHTLQAITGPDATAWVVPLDVEGLLDYARQEGRDPASRSTRLAYSDSLQGAGRDVAWPPERNAPCWCGSMRKYKKCCGDPGFLAADAPDPASLVLRVELDGVRPPVWRRIAVPSNTTLDQVHQMIQTAMGWEDVHLYAFQTEAGMIHDPRSAAPGLAADGERVVSVACEPGEQFCYLYDYGDDWWHTVTVEEVRAAGEENTFRILGGSGGCPPEDCGGPVGYLRLLRALNDLADPDHFDALDWLGEDFDPARYDEPQATAESAGQG
jgi:hypothetical protein